MSTAPNYDNAFPCHYPRTTMGATNEMGITRREYFAAAALPAVILKMTLGVEETVRMAYEFADQMIKVREQ